MNVLVLNVGSATLKFQVVCTDEARIASDGDEKLARGQIERIGGEAVISVRNAAGEQRKLTASLREGHYVPFGPFLALAGITGMVFGPGAILAAIGVR